MAAVKRKRVQKHPGVVIVKPEGRHGWRIRYTEPDTGKVAKPAIPPEHAGTLEERAKYAAAKSEELATRKVQLREGAVPATGSALDDTVEHYFTDNGHLDPDTIRKRRVVTRKLLAWAALVKITKADDLTQPALLNFRAALVKERKRVAKPGGKRGEYISTDEKRSEVSVNHDIGEIVTVLRYLRKKRLLARTTYEDIQISLTKLRELRDPPTYMKPAACRKLLAAALTHDSETHAMTRAEARGDGAPGSTHVYDPIAPFVLFMLLTGMRAEEGCVCEWPWVDLDAQDERGKPAGEIRIPSNITKYGIGRVLVLDVSRTLRDLLIALQPEPKMRKGRLFNLSEYQIRSALERLQDGNVEAKRAPVDSNWQLMRRTCSTYLTNAPGIFVGGSSAWRSAAQLGHDVKVAQTDYLGLIRISPDARTLEAAMQIDAEADRILAEQQARTGAWPSDRPGKPAKVVQARALN